MEKRIHNSDNPDIHRAKLSMKINVGIVEDDATEGKFVQSVEGHSRLRCVAACKSGGRRFQSFPRQPDVVLMDINLPGITPAEMHRLLKQRLPKAQILSSLFIPTTTISLKRFSRCQRYLLKSTGSDEVILPSLTSWKAARPMTARCKARDRSVSQTRPKKKTDCPESH